jgi:hypothetical protein
LGQLKALLDQALNANDVQDAVLWLNGVVHECDKLLRLLHESRESGESARPNLDLETGEFDLIYGRALMELSKTMEDPVPFLEAAIFRFEVGLERSQTIVEKELYLGVLQCKLVRGDEDVVEYAETCLETLESGLEESTLLEFVEIALDEVNFGNDELGEDAGGSLEQLDEWTILAKRALSHLVKISDESVENLMDSNAACWLWCKLLVSLVTNRQEDEKQDALAMKMLKQAQLAVKDEPIESPEELKLVRFFIFLKHKDGTTPPPHGQLDVRFHATTPPTTNRTVRKGD